MALNFLLLWNALIVKMHIVTSMIIQVLIVYYFDGSMQISIPPQVMPVLTYNFRPIKIESYFIRLKLYI